MANRKISELNELNEPPESSDFIVLNDISDTSGSLQGTTKKITVGNLSQGITGDFISLKDTPFEYSSGKYLVSSSDGLEFIDLPVTDSDISSLQLNNLENISSLSYKFSSTQTQSLSSLQTQNLNDVSSLAFENSLRADKLDEDISSLQIKNLIEHVSLSNQLDQEISSLQIQSSIGISSLNLQHDYLEKELSEEISSLQKQRNSDEHITDTEISSLQIQQALEEQTTDKDISSLSAKLIQSFIELEGAPENYSSGQYLKSTDSGLEFSEIADPILSFTGLEGTPDNFSSSSGQYLIVNTDEDSVSFTGISKIANDLTSYGFARGPNDASFIDSLITKTEAGPINKRSTDTTASSTNYYRVPIESLRFNDLEFGATYRISVRMKGYNSSDDPGAGLTIYQRDNSFSSDVNLDQESLETFNNNGGETNSAVISLSVAGNENTNYGQSYFESRVFEATGSHLDVLATSVSANSFIEGIVLQLEKITTSHKFCKAAPLSTATVGHTPVCMQLDQNNLAENSTDLIHTDTDNNLVGILIPEEGSYNISFHAGAKQETEFDMSHWINYISSFKAELKVKKVDESIISLTTCLESKDLDSASNINCNGSNDYVFFDAGDLVYLEVSLHDNMASSYTFSLSDDSYLSVSTSITGPGSLGRRDFAGLVDTPSEFEDGKYLISTASGIAFTNLPEKSFTQLTDTPSSYNNGKYLVSTTNGITFQSLPEPIVEFKDLTDTPNSFTAGKYLKVNSQANGIEFTDLETVNFLGLTDTPSSYSNGKYLVSTSNGLSFTDLPPQPTFIQLSDTPSSYNNGKFLASTTNGLAFQDIPQPVVSFDDLSDTPNSFSAGKYLRVNSAGTALEYADAGTNYFLNLYDTPSSYSNGKYLTSTTNGLVFTNLPEKSFTQLTDTPSSYNNGKYLVSTSNGLQYQDLPEPIVTFTGLTDTPDQLDASKYIRVNESGSALEYVSVEQIRGETSTEFLTLIDTPTNYTHHGGKYVKVSSDEDGLQFISSSELLGLGDIEGYDSCADFQLQSNTSNNSTVFTDISSDPYNIASEGVIHSNNKIKYGSSSLYFNGNSRLHVGDQSSFRLISKKLLKKLTIQLWVYPTKQNVDQPLLGTAGNNTDHGFSLVLKSNNKLQFNSFKGLTDQSSVTLNSSQTIPINTWTHIAIVKNSNDLNFYINGQSSGYISWTNSGSNMSTTYPLYIGGLELENSNPIFFEGYMQDIRIDRTPFNPMYFPPGELSPATCNTNQSEITFESLKDTPPRYTNYAGKFLRVSESESSLEYAGISVASTTYNEFTDSYITGDINQNEIISDLNFGHLEIGKTYRLSTTMALHAETENDFPKVDFFNGDKKICTVFNEGSSSTSSASMLFIARDENIFASGRDLSSTAYIMGDPEISFMQIELPPTVAVQLDEEITPPTTTGETLFEIADIMSQAIIDDRESSFNLSEAFSSSGVFEISDIKLNLNISDENATELLDLEDIIQNFDTLKISDARMQLNTSVNHPEISNITSEIPLFGVLKLSMIKSTSTLHEAGIGENMTDDLPTEAFYS